MGGVIKPASFLLFLTFMVVQNLIFVNQKEDLEVFCRNYIGENKKGDGI